MMDSIDRAFSLNIGLQHMVLFWMLFTLLPKKQLFPRIYTTQNRCFLQPTLYLCPGLFAKEKIFEDYSLQERPHIQHFQCEMNRPPAQENSPPYLLNAHSKSTARPSWCTEIHFSILEEHVLFSRSALQYFIV